MDRIIAVILGLLIILVGFAVIMNIQEAANEPGQIATTAECRIQGGQCTQTCNGETLNADCGEEGVCCAEPNLA